MKSPGSPPYLKPVWFRIGSESARLMEALTSEFRAECSRLPRTRLTYYDTFDWRLHRAGSTVWTETFPDKAGLTLYWETPEGNTIRAVREAPPAFARELTGTVFARLTSITEPRRLIEILSLESSGHRLAVLDSLDKTVVRAFLRQHQVPGDSNGQPPEPFVFLCVVPVKGYVRAFTRFKQFLQDRFGLESTNKTPWLLGLERIGNPPGAYTSALRVQLEPGSTAGDAVRSIYEVLLAKIVLNAQGTREELDPEFLHDFRVAVRRTRSGLTQIKGIFAKGAVRRFKNDFKWLGTVTGPKRDLDVHLLNLNSNAATLPPALRPGLEALQRLLLKRAAGAQERLVQAMDSKRFLKTTHDWKEFLEDTTLHAGHNAARPVLEVAREHIGLAYQQVLERGGSLHPASPACEFHSLRIDCKKLRYLLEFFRSVFEEEKVGPVLGSLKELQDKLGAINDYEVQVLTLQELGRELYERRLGGEKAVMAVGVLVDRAERGQAREYDSFGGQFRAFSSARNRRLFRSLVEDPAARRTTG